MSVLLLLLLLLLLSFEKNNSEILSKAVNSRTGKSLSKRLISQFEMIEQKREEDLERVRLKHISLRTTLRKLERNLRAKEHLAEGLHMIDFEQLKIENQTLNEKIEERNEELGKLKRKKTVTVQVKQTVCEIWMDVGRCVLIYFVFVDLLYVCLSVYVCVCECVCNQLSFH